MTIEIKTATIQPRRQTYANVARRLGADKPASRYDESMFDLQATGEFHYRPTWAPDFELFDARRTAIVLEDWHVLRDPRQFYYGTYTIARSRMMEAAEKAFAYAERRGHLNGLAEGWARLVHHYLLPLRHYEWGANMNNCNITDIGFGSTITEATMFATMDRLGIAQVISRIGLLLDGGTGGSLTAAKAAWLNHPSWQGLRHAIEDLLVEADWFEVFVAQNLVMDGLIYPLVYRAFDDAGQVHGGAALSPLTEFMLDWFDETARWVDAVVGAAAKESPANALHLSRWAAAWTGRLREALQPLAQDVLGDGAAGILDALAADLATRCRKIGLEA
ncbi:aromatic/alkene monooxygenase hydroxylase subunit beta [Zavarzinia compransoris]|uniref:Phenol hydroxylase n=1 Tax=Zavarzinia compransoris TaxID=1264899 RepID=A0A317DTD0_9PROT|nr:aromatic/alkene monooxygenase hydroxylase subunit beta [Zavarzinia compransoris]PWR17948.1 phenol hydroxylase [Zavarzinia compransoris]TDP40079.1 phenol 2-monooxygenase P1 subunit [Zavarzinia compransoris]